MEIIKAKYQDEKNEWINLTFDDGTTGQESNDDIRRRWTDLFDEWVVNGGVVEPFKTEEEIAEQELQNSINTANQFLNETDFYIIRKMEENIDVPEDIATQRADAKQLLRDNDISYTGIK